MPVELRHAAPSPRDGDIALMIGEVLRQHEISVTVRVSAPQPAPAAIGKRPMYKEPDPTLIDISGRKKVTELFLSLYDAAVRRDVDLAREEVAASKPGQPSQVRRRTDAVTTYVNDMIEGLEEIPPRDLGRRLFRGDVKGLEFEFAFPNPPSQWTRRPIEERSVEETA